MRELIDRRRGGEVYEHVAMVALLALFFGLSPTSARHKSITIDEAKNYEYGLQILNLNSYRLNSGGSVVDDSKMPFSALNALPAKLTPFLPEGWPEALLGDNPSRSTVHDPILGHYGIIHVSIGQALVQKPVGAVQPLCTVP